LVRAGKNEATNGAGMGNIKIKMEFSLAQCLCMAAGCHGNGEKIKRTSLSLSPYLVPLPSTNRGEQQGENQIQKEKKSEPP
jgi:hypothetical protein